MRLINVRTMQLELFQGEEKPPFAILSHTWGTTEEEVLFNEFQQNPAPRQRPGYAKIERMCQEAESHGINYAWADTSCIDKSSSAELSEAINSMFKWYGQATICYAYLSDVELPNDQNPAQLSNSALDHLLRKSRWFTRGWTLQELLAPREVIFFDANWRRISDKISCSETISSITGIDHAVILDPSALLHDRSTAASRSKREGLYATRMSWAAKRMTSRPEDIAYCLMGLFHVHMPLLYGEGSENAFRRLQYQMMQKASSNSLLAWGLKSSHCIEPTFDRNKIFPKELVRQPILAKSPADFNSTPKDIYTFLKSFSEYSSWAVTNRGIETEMLVITHESWFVEEQTDERGFQRRHDLAIAMLPFKPSREETEYFGFLLSGDSKGCIYNRVCSLEGASGIIIPPLLAIQARSQRICLSDAHVHDEWRSPRHRLNSVLVTSPTCQVQSILTNYCDWNAQKQQLMLHFDAPEELQVALFEIIDQRSARSSVYLLIFNSTSTPDILPTSSLQRELLPFGKLGMSVISEENVETFIGGRSRLSQHFKDSKPEIVIDNVGAKLKISLHEHQVCWDIIYVLSITRLADRPSMCRIM